MLRAAMMPRQPSALALLLPLAIGPAAAAEDQGSAAVIVSETQRVTPRPGSAFHWPYYLFIPAEVQEARAGTRPALLVVPNNTGSVSDDPLVHDRDARKRCGQGRSQAEHLGVPLLTPAFPRPEKDWHLYTHALDRDTLLATDPALRRLDLQLLSMIDDAAARLRTRPVPIALREQVLLSGFSASAMFAHRFALLHPERVLAVAAGSPGGWLTAPLAMHKGQRLRYPVGVADLAALAGRPFAVAAFQRVRCFFYLGAQDDNDSVPFDDGYDAPDRAQVNALFGATPVARWPRAEALYREAGSACTFKLYPGVTHVPSQAMMADVDAFLRRALAEDTR